MRLEIKESTKPQTPYITDFSADILADSGELAGKRAFSLLRIQEMIDDEVGILENFEDCTDFAYASTVLGEDFLKGNSNKLTELGRILDRNGNFNILVLKCLEILPEFRGKGYGKQADYKVHDYLKRQYGLVVKKASPLQYEDFSLNYDPVWANRMGYREMQGDRRKDTEALIRKYESWGYTRIPGTDCLYMLPEDK